MTKSICTFLIALFTLGLFAQNKTDYWQQHVDYTMEVDMDVDSYQYTGTQTLVYTNNSPDELKGFTSIYISMPFSQVVKWIFVCKLLQILMDV